jgi:uncharacterized protein YuzE
MKFHYYPETDSLYIELSEKPGVESREVAPNVVLDFDDEGHLVGIDLDHASKFVNLSRSSRMSGNPQGKINIASPKL